MLLDVQGLHKQYRAKGGGFVSAVHDISLELPAGEILAFLGPNGAGKTTSIKIIAGLIHPDSGDVWIGGHSVRKDARHALRHMGAVLEGSRNLYWRLTPIENFEYWGGIRGIPRSVARAKGRELLHEFGLDDKANHTVQKLSRGMQQQVAICVSIIHNPSLLLLDEPTLGLDLEASDRIQALVRKLAIEQNIGILLTTHQLDIAQALSDRICIIQKGELVVEGRTSEVLEEFSGNAYCFDLGEPLSNEVRQRLEMLGAEFESDKRFRMAVTKPEDIYTVLAQIAPCPVVRMERDTADLARVFRHYTQAALAEEVYG